MQPAATSAPAEYKGQVTAATKLNKSWFLILFIATTSNYIVVLKVNEINYSFMFLFSCTIIKTNIIQQRLTATSQDSIGCSNASVDPTNIILARTLIVVTVSSVTSLNAGRAQRQCSRANRWKLVSSWAETVEYYRHCWKRNHAARTCVTHTCNLYEWAKMNSLNNKSTIEINRNWMKVCML